MWMSLSRKWVRSADLAIKCAYRNIHLHTVEADSEKILDEIETRLAEKGFLKNK